LRKQISIRLDIDTIGYFKKKAEETGIAYQREVEPGDRRPCDPKNLPRTSRTSTNRRGIEKIPHAEASNLWYARTFGTQAQSCCTRDCRFYFMIYLFNIIRTADLADFYD